MDPFIERIWIHLFDMNSTHTEDLTTDAPKRDVNKKSGKIKNDFRHLIDHFIPDEFNTWKRQYNKYLDKRR